MAAAKRAPRIVAELGRPETPEETAARLAENSRLYRSRKTINNLVLSLLATLVAVLFIVLLVPRSDTPMNRDVDYHAIAADAQRGVDVPLADPDLPERWKSNAAEWRTGGGDKVRSWYIGLITPKNQYIGLTQALDSNPTWRAAELQKQPATGTTTIDGVTWDVYRNTKPEKDRGNFDYALVTEAGRSTFLLVGTASEGEFRTVAKSVAAQVMSNGAVDE